MKRLTLVVLCIAYPAHVFGQAKDADEKKALEKLRARCVDASALVYAPEERNEPVLRAGALVLNREKRLLLALHTNVAHEPTVVFPAYSSKGELLDKPADYAELWKKGERWKGKVLHRDKYLDLVVIELDRSLPERTREAEFAINSTKTGTTVYSLTQIYPDEEPVWGLGEGTVRAVGREADSGGVPAGRAPRHIVASTAPRGSGPEFGLFNRSGHVVAFPEPSFRPQQVETRLDVTEVRAFLIENKVPFKSAEEPAAKDTKAK